MTSDSHFQLYVDEAREKITELNNALLALEDDASDREALDESFRSAHTVKGNSMAMGYDGIGELAHAVEDLLDEMRDGCIEVTPETMDVAFDGLDEMEAAIAEVADDGTVDRDLEPVQASIHERVEAVRGGDEGDVDAGSAGPAESAGGGGSAPDESAVEDDAADAVGDADAEAGAGSYVLALDLEGANLPGADAMLALEAVEDRATIEATRPERDAITSGEYDGGFEVDVRTADPDALVERVESERAVTAVELDGGGANSDASTGAHAGTTSTTGDVTTSPDGTRSDGARRSVLGRLWTAIVSTWRGSPATNEGARGPPTVGDGGSAEAAPTDDTADSPASTRDPNDLFDGDDEADDAAADATSNHADGSTAKDDTDGAASEDADGGTDADGGANGEADEAGDATDAGAASVASDAGVEVGSVRVDVDRLDELYGIVEQLYTTRIRLRRIVEAAGVDEAGDQLDTLDKNTTQLQDAVMDMRLVPVSHVLDRFPRTVRDLAREQDLEVDLVIEGDDIEVDRVVLDEISDPLMHLVRNAVDHGIEHPEEREAAGKSREGTVEIRARRERDQVEIEIEDDGAGLDPDQLRDRAVEEGVHDRSTVEAMSDDEAYDLIFEAGLSTAAEVTDVSGRGVGMDVVRQRVKELDGSVDLDSEPGHGTTVTLRLPVTVAIVEVLFVDVGEATYGIPIKEIDRITRDGDIQDVNGRRSVEYEEEIYPVVSLNEVFGEEVPEDDGDRRLLYLQPDRRKAALLCDGVHDHEEVVVKPLAGPIANTPGLSGTTVLGDGDVVPIVDVQSLGG